MSDITNDRTLEFRDAMSAVEPLTSEMRQRIEKLRDHEQSKAYAYSAGLLTQANRQQWAQEYADLAAALTTLLAQSAKVQEQAATLQARDAEIAMAPKCAVCGKPASCLGTYEMDNPWAFACDACCGHGNEDGCCYRLEDLPEKFTKDEKWEEEQAATLARLTKERDDALADARKHAGMVRYYEETEAALCPEDVGFDEYIESLTKENQCVTAERDALLESAFNATAKWEVAKERIAALESALRQIEWTQWNHLSGADECPFCNHEKPNHAPDCQLAAVLESAPSGSPWQPIGSAEEDESVLVYCGFVAEAVLDSELKAWRFVNTNDAIIEPPPTHWMPLPPPPLPPSPTGDQ